jgi:hypothetical protein
MICVTYILGLELPREQINVKNFLRYSPFLSVSIDVREWREGPLQSSRKEGTVRYTS